MNGFPIITVLTFTPLVGALLVLGIPSGNRVLARTIALVFSALALGWAALMWMSFDPHAAGIQFEEHHDWITAFGAASFHAQYRVGVDGLSILMVALTALVTPLALLSSRKIEDKTPLFLSMMLLLQAGLFGTFTALNFFHWFLFWELSLVPAFFLIKLWGGPGRGPAATQFFIYTVVGSVAMLLSFLAIYLSVDTFDFTKLAELGSTGQLSASLYHRLGGFGLTQEKLTMLVFAGVFLGFAVKVPLVPFHTWLPAAYTEAPTSVTMMLTGLMSKMGVYGFLRILLPLFPEQMRIMFTPLLWLAVATIVLPACAAYAQRDLKRIFAYSSINHLGYCLLGVFALARLTGTQAPWDLEKSALLDGVLLQMFNHGLTASMLFCFVGLMEERTGGVRSLEDFGGLRKVAPVLCGLMGIAIFASLGLPGLNGFIGEFLIFKGAFPLATWATALSVLGLLATAVFLLTVLQRVFNGPLNNRWTSLPDLSVWERWLVVPAIALMFVLGIFPQLAIGQINPTVMNMVAQLKF
jgi:NADH-quinone oxidoreductase subunit M